MVIATSDSTGTLVSLDTNEGKTHVCGGSSFINTNNSPRLQPTALYYLPEQDVDSLYGDDDGYESDGTEYYNCAYSEQQSVAPQCLYLPYSTTLEVSVEECLPMALIEGAEELLAQPPVHFTKDSIDRVLYVAQGEVAHAVPLQCDVIMSDRATTCHILAMRSSSSGSCSPPLTSVAHIDETHYEECLRDMVQRHYLLHGESKKGIDMDLHIVGGFEDETSRRISNWLLHTLAAIASDYPEIKFSLKTCAISSLNDRGSEPIGRGLAVDTRSGRVFLAKADSSIIPCLALRSARLFQRGGSRPLACIYDQKSNELIIQPFVFEPFSGADRLLRMDDDVFLRCTSTSPHCEEDDFCSSLRSTLKFVRDVAPSAVFGKRVDQPLRIKRTPGSGRNAWKTIRRQIFLNT